MDPIVTFAQDILDRHDQATRWFFVDKKPRGVHSGIPLKFYLELIRGKLYSHLKSGNGTEMGYFYIIANNRATLSLLNEGDFPDKSLNDYDELPRMRVRYHLDDPKSYRFLVTSIEIFGNPEKVHWFWPEDSPPLSTKGILF